ncbi:MAG: FAD-dependent oxidoreductase [Rhodospirillaceae bacterium]|nr:FAD-dependent oxidoreductase [Rhodospirillaceae bacterium]|tara:strand:+ start:5185 stop:6165 length:981 start_codon:yes stop_codon:yes gene_type:complete
MVDISIVGAGVVGLCVATELLNRGLKVRVYDKAGKPGPHACSWWAGGMLAPFCEAESAEEPVSRLGREAASWWECLTPVYKRGSLVVAAPRDTADLKRFARLTQNHRTLVGSDITELEPDLESRFVRALFFEDEAHINPREALQSLYNLLHTSGADFVPSPPPDSLSNYIDCRGLAANDCMNDLRGVKGEMLIIRTKEICFTRPIRLLHPRIPLYIVPRGDGVYMVGATTIESHDSERVSVRSMLELLSAAYALNPAFGEAEILETGVDLRPAFSDNLPKIRRLGNAIFANGLYRHGYLLAPVVAKQVANLYLNNIAGEFVDEHHS